MALVILTVSIKGKSCGKASDSQGPHGRYHRFLQQSNEGDAEHRAQRIARAAMISIASISIETSNWKASSDKLLREYASKQPAIPA